jgi:serine/threonine protein kinase
MVRASDHAICENCGAALAAPGAECDRCLMRRALESPDSGPLGPGFLDDLPMPGESDVIVGKYTILATVARGGMGVVYQARQAPLNRVVALKMLLGGTHASDDFRRRFLQEAQAAARLNHPAIVKILDWGEDNGQPFFAMEFIEGADLGAKMRGQPLSPRRAAEIVLTLAEAIEYAHSQGVLHRDLKPSNVLLDSHGAPRITDFGLAKQLDQESTSLRAVT